MQPVKPQTRTTLPYLALGVGLLGLAFSGIFVKWASVPGAASSFYRMGIATVVLAIPFYSVSQRAAPLSRPHVGWAILAGLCFAADLVAWQTAVLITSAGTATLMGNTSPIWVGLGAVIFFREKLRRAFWLGLALALAGAVVIVGRDYLLHPTVGVGDLLGLLAGFFFGGFFLATQRAREQLGAFVSWWISAAASAVVALIASLILGQPLWGYSMQAYASLIGLALVTQVGGYLTINYALGYLPASIVSPIMLAQPVLTALLAVYLLDQPITLWHALGGALVLGGIWIVNRYR